MELKEYKHDYKEAFISLVLAKSISKSWSGIYQQLLRLSRECKLNGEEQLAEQDKALLNISTSERLALAQQVTQLKSSLVVAQDKTKASKVENVKLDEDNVKLQKELAKANTMAEEST
ncbi:hypothetical protein ACFE04_007391 [Oxalis oulophora]